MHDCTESWFCSKPRKVGRKQAERAALGSESPGRAEAWLGLREARLGRGRNLEPGPECHKAAP